MTESNVFPEKQVNDDLGINSTRVFALSWYYHHIVFRQPQTYTKISVCIAIINCLTLINLKIAKKLFQR